MNWRTGVFALSLLAATLMVWGLLSGEQAGKVAPFVLQESLARVQPGTDYFIEGVYSQHFDTQGQLSHALRAPRISHDQETDAILMQSPHIAVARHQAEPWQLHADSATGAPQLQQLALHGNVRITQGLNFKPQLQLETDWLSLNLHDKTASTESPVRFTGQGSQINAIGLNADLHNETLHLRQQVKAHYEKP